MIDQLFAKNKMTIIASIPDKIVGEFTDLMGKPYGAYIVQNPNDPTVCGSSEYIDIYEASEMVMKCINLGSKFYGDADPTSIITYMMAQVSIRLGPRNNKYSVASLLKYYFTVMEIKEAAKTLVSEDTSQVDLNMDGLPMSHELNDAYWDSISERDRAALAYMGSDIYSPHLVDDRIQLNTDASPVERIHTLFASPKYRAYKSFVYDKSEKSQANSVRWLKARALRLLDFSVKQGAPPSGKVEIEAGIDLYTDSMKTSTTGATLGCSQAVFSPKSVEATRLLTNLFTHHLPQMFESPDNELLKACAEKVGEFETYESEKAAKSKSAPSKASHQRGRK